MTLDSDINVRVKNLGVEIEKIKASNPDLSYIDCTIEICTILNLDVEDMKRSLPKAIKEKIEAEALKKNLLKYKLNTVL